MRRFLSSLLGFILLLIVWMQPAQAASTILPSASETADCESILEEWNLAYMGEGVEGETSGYAALEEIGDGETMLGCAIRTGEIRFWMIPLFVNYVLEFLIGLAGLIAVLMVVIGGYYYIYGAITDDKEKGKTIISYALGGFMLVLSSWFLVNLLLLAVSA